MSIWVDIHKRSNGDLVRKEDQVLELKQKLKAAAQQYVETFVEHKLTRKYTVEEIQELLECETLIAEKVVEKMKEEDQSKFWVWVENNPEGNDYAEDAFWEAVDEIVSTLNK